MKESDIQRDILTTLSNGDNRLWRNNRGEAWIGKSVMLPSGDVLIKHGRRISFGLVNGAADIIGEASKIVTQDMVGRRVAVFTGLEVKRDKQYGTHDQRHFLRFIRDAGGIGEIVRSVEDARAALEWRRL